MLLNFTHDKQVLELVKNNEHFVLVYPKTSAGRMTAIEALRDWLFNCELDFDHHDVELFRKAIDASRFQATLDRFSERGTRWGRRRN